MEEHTKKILEETTFTFPGWDVETIINRIRQVLETEKMTSIDLHLHASVTEIPTLEYQISQYAYKAGS